MAMQCTKQFKARRTYAQLQLTKTQTTFIFCLLLLTQRTPAKNRSRNGGVPLETPRTAAAALETLRNKLSYKSRPFRVYLGIHNNTRARFE